MSAGTKVLTGGSSELIIAADGHRDHITIQLQDTTPVFLAFGDSAVAADTVGIKLIYPGCSVRVTGNKARQEVYGYAAAGTVVGIETCEDVEYRPGSYIGL